MTRIDPFTVFKEYAVIRYNKTVHQYELWINNVFMYSNRNYALVMQRKANMLSNALKVRDA